MTLPLLAAVALSALLSLALIVLLQPLFRRYALARPNARSSHARPTPQGGGLGIVGAGLAVAVVLGGTGWDTEATALAMATLVLAGVGAVDDMRPLPASLRLGVQTLAVSAVLWATGGRLLPDLPLGVERGLEILAVVWFVNLVNFMDGLDWMTVAEVVPLATFLVLLAGFGLLPAPPGLVAAALLGGLLGFAPFNRPVARLFLGDAGSLPIGLVVAWLLYRLALEGGFAAALILPLYPVADATLTLARRTARREPLWQAHRSHFYQRAVANGWLAKAVVGRVFGVNVVLVVLAAGTLLRPSWPVTVGALAAAALLVAGTLRSFAGAPPRSATGEGPRP